MSQFICVILGLSLNSSLRFSTEFQNISLSNIVFVKLDSLRHPEVFLKKDLFFSLRYIYISSCTEVKLQLLRNKENLHCLQKHVLCITT